MKKHAFGVSARDLLSIVTKRPDLTDKGRAWLRDGILHHGQEITLGGKDFEAMAAIVTRMEFEPRLTVPQEAAIHQKLVPFLSKQDQGRVMTVIREVLRPSPAAEANDAPEGGNPKE